MQYVDYAAWQRNYLDGPVLERQLQYWQAQLQDAPPLLDLPTDTPRPMRPTYAGGWIKQVLPQELKQQLNEFARSQGSTLYMLTLAAFNVLLFRWTRQEDLVVGTPVAGRHHPGTEEMLGLFVNSLAIRTQADPQQGFNEYLAQVNEISV